MTIAMLPIRSPLVLIALRPISIPLPFVRVVVVTIASAGVGIEVFDLEVDVVHDRAEDSYFGARQEVESTGDRLLAGKSGTNYHDGSVGSGCDRQGVRNHENWGAIDHHVVVYVTPPLNELRHAVGSQQFGRVGRLGPG